MNVTLDECFQFGLGAFETIGIEQGIPILLDGRLKNIWKNRKCAQKYKRNLETWSTVH